jgi:hypothetical protein
LPFCLYRPVQADAGLPAWSSLPTELDDAEGTRIELARWC